jgi:hypothetical protein
MKALSRRSILLLPLSAWASSHFWDKDDPSTWTADEITQLTTKSPWAKEATAELKSNDSNMAGAAPRAAGRGRRGGGSAGAASPGLPKFQSIVRWASAKPIREALKLKFPESLAGHYVISVSGLPIISPGDTGDDSFATIKDQTALLLKRGEPIQPGVAYQDPNDTSTIYFGFLPQLANVADAKTAIFTMSTGPLEVKVKFNLEEMKYRGELAV